MPAVFRGRVIVSHMNGKGGRELIDGIENAGLCARCGACAGSSSFPIKADIGLG
jgi:hypothetical protein